MIGWFSLTPARWPDRHGAQPDSLWAQWYTHDIVESPLRRANLGLHTRNAPDGETKGRVPLPAGGYSKDQCGQSGLTLAEQTISVPFSGELICF